MELGQGPLYSRWTGDSNDALVSSKRLRLTKENSLKTDKKAKINAIFNDSWTNTRYVQKH